MALTFSTQPKDASVKVGAISGSLTVAVTGSSSITYQWYQAKSKDSVAGATPVSSATAASMAIPTSLKGGTYYYFCRATSTDAGSADSNIATVTVAGGALPELPEHITGAFVHDYLEQCTQEVRDRFDARCVYTGITIPDSDKVLYTSQLELFMSIL